MSVSLEKLTDLIEEARTMSDDLYDGTRYNVYETLGFELRDMLRTLEEQETLERLDKIKSEFK